jgi:DNA-binding CsgD family transcriptional regulator
LALRTRKVLETVAGGDGSSAGEPEYGDIRGLLWLLTPREKRVVLLRTQSLEYQHIAVQLEVSAKTAAALLTGARRKLQHEVQGATQRPKSLHS